MRRACLSETIRTTVAVLAVGMMLAAGPASACGFHNYLPAKTVVDRLLESDHIVLARPDPKNPFQYTPVEAIEGELEWVEIPFLVSMSNRRRLAANPAEAVLFARDGAYGPWQQLAYIDAAYRPVLKEIVTRLPAWADGDLRDRIQLFADLHAHPDDDVRRLALAELDRAPYGLLRTLAIEPDAADIIENLSSFDEYSLLPIRVLLLGLGDDAAARDVLMDGVQRQATGIATPTLGAYATALVEMEGEAGITTLGELLARDRLAPGAPESLVEALAIHAETGDERIRSKVHVTVAGALSRNPALAAVVVRQFGSRGDYSQALLLARLLREGAFGSVEEFFAVSQYIALAQAPAGALTEAPSFLPSEEAPEG